MNVMNIKAKAIMELQPNIEFKFQGEVFTALNGWSLPTEEEIQAKIAELEAAEPLRLLRIERDRLLQQTDWEVQRNTERNITDSNLIDYRNALRDLPQEIANGNIPAPTLDENGMLAFEHWPIRGGQNA